MQDQSDGGREETFVDAPDELGGRGIDLGDSMAMVDLGESSEEHSSPENLARVSSECRKYKVPDFPFFCCKKNIKILVNKSLEKCDFLECRKKGRFLGGRLLAFTTNFKR